MSEWMQRDEKVVNRTCCADQWKVKQVYLMATASACVQSKREFCCFALPIDLEKAFASCDDYLHEDDDDDDEKETPISLSLSFSFSLSLFFSLESPPLH